MPASGDIGIVTTDAELVVQSWDDWVARAMSIPTARAKGRPLAALVAGLEEPSLLARFRQTLTSGAVQVFSPALHRTVFPCTPRVPSPHFSLMQQRVTVGPLHDHERVVGLIITIQDVTAQLDEERNLAAALASDDPGTRHAAAETIAQSGRIESLESFTPALRNENWRVRRAAVCGLAAAADQELLEAMLETIRREHRNFSTLSSALKLFAVTDVDITAPLAGLLKDDDVDLRIQAALALGEQHSPAAVEPLLQALDDPDPNVRFHAIEALGRLRAEPAVDALIGIAESGDPFLAFAALDALGLIRDPRAAPRLVPLLTDPVLRDGAAHALSTLGDHHVVAPLVDALNTSADAALAVMSALATIATRLERDAIDVGGMVREGLSPTGERHVLTAAADPPVSAMPALARILGWAGSDDAIEALGRLLSHSAARDAAVDALVRLGDRSADLLIEKLSSGDDGVRAAAIGALGRLGIRKATSPLIAALDEPDTVIGVCGALARIGDTAAFEPLLRLVGHPDAAVRLAAIGALNSIGHPGMPARITALLDDEDPLMRESAVRIAGYFGYPETFERLMIRAGDAEEAVRIAALEHLPFYDDDGRSVTVLADALARDTPRARAAAARALARVDDNGAVALLLAALRDHDPWVRYFSARSLGERRDGGKLPELAEAAEGDTAQPVRIAALGAIGSRGVPVPTGPLVRSAADENPEIAAAALLALGRLGGDAALHVLRDAARNPDARRRTAAIGGLSALATPEAVAELEWVAAGTLDPASIEEAVGALAAIAAGSGAAGPLAVDSMVALFADAERHVHAARAVAGLPLELVPRVARGLSHPQPAVRRRTVDALASFRRAEATRLLEPAFSDAEPEVREAAAVAVMRLGTSVFEETLRHLAASDVSKAVRRAATGALTASRNTN